MRTILSILLSLVLPALSAQDKIVLYCALDEPYAAPILKAFEKETGIQVKTVFDSEAVKTAGLVNRIIAERERPQCDVFWNNEKLRTVLLARRGLLQKYESPMGKKRKIPRDEKTGLWSEFAGRMRVVAFRKKDLEGAAFFETVDSEWIARPHPGRRIAIAHPLFGTTSTQFLYWMSQQRKKGADPAKWLERVMATKPLICQGNSDVVRRVLNGQADLGITDSDDVFSSNREVLGASIFESILIPNTVAILKSAPHPDAAMRFVDFLLSERTEEQLAMGVSQQIPLGTMTSSPSGTGLRDYCLRANEEELIETMEQDFELIRKALSK